MGAVIPVIDAFSQLYVMYISILAHFTSSLCDVTWCQVILFYSTRPVEA